MPRSVGRKARKARSASNLLDNLRPHDQGKGTRSIAMRFRHKEGTSFERKCAPVPQVSFEKPTRDGSISHDSLAPILGVLSSHANLPVGEVKITDLKSHEFLAAQRSIVGSEHHDLVSKRLLLERTQHVLPFLIGGKPGEFLVMWEESSI